MKHIYVVMLFICSSINIFSQSDSLKSNFALTFGIEDIFKLNSFDLDIGFKKIISETDELRIFLSPRFSNYNNENEIDPNNQNSKDEMSNFSLGIKSDYLWRIIKKDEFSLFAGPGLFIRYGIGTHEAKNNDLVIIENNKNNLYFGLRGILGVEWKVNERIGIHSEYQYLGNYRWSKSETKTYYDDNNKSKSITKNYGVSFGSNVLFGLSIYL